MMKCEFGSNVPQEKYSRESHTDEPFKNLAVIQTVLFANRIFSGGSSLFSCLKKKGEEGTAAQCVFFVFQHKNTSFASIDTINAVDAIDCRSLFTATLLYIG